MTSKWIKVLLGALALGGAALLGANPRDGLDVRLSVAQPVLSGDVDVAVDVSVTNVTRAPIHVLRWQLPGEEAEGALFRITREDGSRAPYQGAVVKRAKPESNDFVKLDPGATLSYRVELTADYDLSRNGRYMIEYVARGAHGAAAPQLQSQPVYLWLEGRTAKTALAPAPAATTGGLSYARCTTSQQSAISLAVDNALLYANDGLAYLNGNKQGARYTTWFGAYDSSRHATVRIHFMAIADAFATKPITVDCSCKKKNVYAFVYPTQPYTITVCGAFWTASATGTDSKAGTLIHEMSHFNVVASTDDWAYGQSAAKALAISDPTKAIDNADSHEYFAENTPFQR